MWSNDKALTERQNAIMSALCDMFTGILAEREYTGNVKANFFKGGLANITKEQSFKLGLCDKT